MKLQPWICLILSSIGLFLSSWIVIPAPTFFLLPLAVAAPELSPFLLLGNGIALGLVLLQRQRQWSRSLAIACSSIGIILSSLPILQLPSTVQQAEQMIHAALGNQYLMQISADQQVSFRPHPFVLADLFSGLPIAAVQPTRQFFPTLDGTRLPLDIYQPPTAQLHPIVVTIYGGAWQRGEPGQNAAFNRYLVRQGYTVAAIDYRHAPVYRFPTQSQDVQAALQWLTHNAVALRIDLTRIALLGWSSGAHLALLAAYQPDAVPVRAVVSYYGPTNLAAGYTDPPHPDPIHTRAVLETFLGESPTLLPKQYEQASPIHYVRPNLPDTLLIYGNRDHLVKSVFGQQLYDQLRLTGNRAVWIPLPWAEHAFDSVFRGLSNQIALYYTERFLAWEFQ
jgi:acetyl esterase/lipase